MVIAIAGNKCDLEDLREVRVKGNTSMEVWFSLSNMHLLSLNIIMKFIFFSFLFLVNKTEYIQSTLVISTLVISNNRLSRREYLIPVLT